MKSEAHAASHSRIDPTLLELIRLERLEHLHTYEVVADPFDLARIEVRYQHRPFGLAVPLVIGRHTHPQAERELLRRPGSTTSSCFATSATPRSLGIRSTSPASQSPKTATARIGHQPGRT